MKRKFSKIVKFFVYGTLRPDIQPKNQTSYCKKWNNPKWCKLKSKKAYIKNHELWMTSWPFVMENKETETDWKDRIVFGFLQEFSPSLKDKEFLKMLQYLDDVEGYPDLYDRKVEDCYIIESFNKIQLTGKEKKEKGYVYVLSEDEIKKRKKFSYKMQTGDYIKDISKKKK